MCPLETLLTFIDVMNLKDDAQSTISFMTMWTYMHSFIVIEILLITLFGISWYFVPIQKQSSCNILPSLFITYLINEKLFAIPSSVITTDS